MNIIKPVDIPNRLKPYFIEQIDKHRLMSTDYSLSFEDRRYSERLVKSFTKKLNKINAQK